MFVCKFQCYMFVFCLSLCSVVLKFDSLGEGALPLYPRKWRLGHSKVALIIIVMHKKQRPMETTHNVHDLQQLSRTVWCLSLLICCNRELRDRAGGLHHWTLGWCPDLTTTACFRIWQAGVLASSVTTWPNSASRLFAIMSLTFGRLVVAAMSRVLYVHPSWQCPSIISPVVD